MCVRPAPVQGLGRRRHPALDRLGHGGRRSGTGHLVTGVGRVGCRTQPAARRPGPARDGTARQHAVHAHATRHRYAQADGDRPRLPREARGVGRHRPPGHRPGRLVGLRTSGMGPVPPRQDQPQLLDVGPLGAHRPDLRRCRQDHRSEHRGSREPGGRRLLEADRVVGRALRRHHDDVPEQLVQGRPPRYLVDVRVRRGHRGEVGRRLQQGQPRRCAQPGREATGPEGPARVDLPVGGHALLRQPVLRARRAVGRCRRARRCRAVRRVRPAAREPVQGARVRVPPCEPRRQGRRSHREGERGRPRPTRDPPRRAAAVGDDRPARCLGEEPQDRPRADGARRVRLDGPARRR